MQTNTLIDRDPWPNEPISSHFGVDFSDRIMARTTLGGETFGLALNWSGEIIAAWPKNAPLGTYWHSA
jgi:hypothetical protein